MVKKRTAIALLTFLLYCGGTLIAQGQSTQEQISKDLIGNWEGAFIKSNSYQKLDMQIYRKDDGLEALQIMEEWHPQFGEFIQTVAVDSTGQISFNTGYGKAKLYLDQKSLEISGAVDGGLPTIYLHLKKKPASPPASYLANEFTFKNGDVELYGHLHESKYGPKETAVIIVGGRSCYAGSTKYDLNAKILREYGISVLVFNKRGTGKSTGDCQNATIADLANDVRMLQKFLKKHPNKYKHIGVLGSSAGGWVAVKAQEKANFDFMITVVGPSTSVRDQQFQSMNYGAQEYKISESGLKDLTEYTNLMFDADANERSFERFSQLLKRAEQDGWKQLLDDTDVPASAQAIDNLWVRRHGYDPQKTLKKFSKPMLAVFGEKDWIVPYKENIALLENFFADRPGLLTTVVAADAAHGTETQAKYINFDENRGYWRFFRISPRVTIEIVEFLEKHNFIKTAH